MTTTTIPAYRVQPGMVVATGIRSSQFVSVQVKGMEPDYRMVTAIHSTPRGYCLIFHDGTTTRWLDEREAVTVQTTPEGG